MLKENLAEKMANVNLIELSKQTKIPVKVLQNMINDGALTQPLGDLDLEFLHRLLSVINKHYFIRHCLLRIRSDKRETFIETASLETRWERYIYTNMANHYALGGKLSIPDIVKHAENVFQFTFTAEHIGRVKKIRDTIYKKQSRHNQKKAPETIGQIAP